MTGALVIGCSSNSGQSTGAESTTTAQGANNQQGGGPGGPGRGGAFGTIASIDGSTLTINSTGFDGSNQIVKVTTSASTTVTETKTGSVGDIKTGDNVTVLGSASGSGSGSEVTAQQITDTGTVAPTGGGGPGGGGFPGGGPGGTFPGGTFPGGANGPGGSFPGRPGGTFPGGANGPRGSFPGGGPGATFPNGGPNGGAGGGFVPTRGVVTAINGSTLTVTPSDGSAAVTVSTSGSTNVSLRVPSSVSALAAGQNVQVQGEADDQGTVAANTINIGGNGFGGGGFPGGPNGGGGFGPPPGG